MTNTNKPIPPIAQDSCRAERLPDVIKYLLGEGELDGHSFPDFPDNGEKYKRRYWWRKALQAAWNARPVEGVVQVCPDCDIADCHHIRSRRQQLTPPQSDVQEDGMKRIIEEQIEDESRR